jgi:hypothetical protein
MALSKLLYFSKPELSLLNYGEKVGENDGM